jgi:hypothetical protein
MAASLSRSSLSAEPKNGLFEITDIPGKGRGLVARRDIPKGTRILCEKPLFTSHGALAMSLNDLEAAFAMKLKGLPKQSQRQFLSLHNNFPGKYPFSKTFKTNALPCGPDSVIGAVYPTICFINHSCIANAHNNWNSNLGHETIHATRHIQVGEEITIPYDKGGPSIIRRAALKESFGFDCDCLKCTLPPSELKNSDARSVLMVELDEAIGDSHRMMTNPKESLVSCYELRQVLDEEFGECAGVLLARMYYDAFQICIAHGDRARAGTFAEKAYEARVICEGEDSPETQNMKSLARKPEDHRNYGGCSKRWNTTKKMVPKNLDAAQFDKWLFRMN